MFYDKFMYLCNKKRVAPSRAAVEAGISKSLVTKWKTNRTQVPSPDILQKLSTYFSVPVSVLLSEETKKEEPTVQDDRLSKERQELIDYIMTLPEEQVRLLLQVAKSKQ